MIAEFVVAALLIELTPGPNMGWLALLAAQRGRSVGLGAVAGVALGLTIAGTAAALGLAFIIKATPWLFQLLRFAGALYLVYLAWEAWRDAEADIDGGTGEPVLHYFSQGLISNMLNPKAYLFYAAVLPQFLPATDASWLDIATLTALYVAVATLVHGAIVLLAGSAGTVLNNKRRRKWLGRSAAVFLVLLAGWFFWSTNAAA